VIIDRGRLAAIVGLDELTDRGATLEEAYLELTVGQAL
jgi:hypothetical protein